MSLDNSGKAPVQALWFRQLQAQNIPEKFEWLRSLGHINSIANFGCWTGKEPFALLWALDATEIFVVEKNEEYLNTLHEQLEIFQNSSQGQLLGRKIQVILADMTLEISELPTNYFDLAYCDEVLYQIYNQKDGEEAVRRAVNEMIKVVRPGGYIVAIESQFGAKIELVEEDWNGIPIIRRIQKSKTIDISFLFTDNRLVKVPIDDFPNIPDWTYCFRKS